MNQQFLVTRADNKRLVGKIGILIGTVDYRGYHSGWHTLQFDDGSTALFTGDEVIEMTDKTKTTIRL